MDNQDLFDITIIGGGTTGLFATYYATMRGMKVKLLESQSQFGGKVMQFFPEKLIYDVGGFPAISGEDLVQQMIAQAERHQPVMLTDQWVETIDNDGKHFTLQTSSGDRHLSKSVLLATGSGTFHTKRSDDWHALPYPAFRKQVPTNLMNREKYADKKVVIASNNKVGVGWALYLKDKAESVTIINPDSSFHQVKQNDLDLLLKSSVQVHFQTAFTDLFMENDRLQAIEISNSENEKHIIDAEEILTFHGLELEPTPFDKWEIETRKARITVKGNMATNVSGIFAAGDIVQYDGKTNLIASGYTEAITAINKAHKFIDPTVTEQLYSTVIYRG
ncbi:NAD(P)/FAD-dependent oxidoreductase [Gracilibacillus kekensis]|uniref:Ferredoxin--NADP reductase n=1 Tax=Gracilibacillus kekensis TaxID=1027249 RepID=A0A1M7QJ78_9BACI|nr:NAD(P)/FAD-dependent oxidoreductase [Gracilibacillus kekensis]SHN31229.1 thioredoxin reductase (NADPH) [Gracilibacillus kekensis]